MQTRIKEHLGRMLTQIACTSGKEFRSEVRFYKKNDFKVITKSRNFVCLERNIETVEIILIKG